ncbi:MAG: penicillin-binding protein, partial [Clostridia bacterium]|nr:penicillin-binding protein [Clostridia bacterium]
MNKGRFAFITVFTLAVFAIFAGRLLQFQIVEGEELLRQADATLHKTLVQKAARGDIVDRYGSIISSNTIEYDVVIQKGEFPTKKEAQKRIEVILSLYTLLESNGDTVVDDLPLVLDQNGSAQFLEDRGSAVSALKKFLSKQDYATAQNCFDQLVKRYGLEDFSAADARKVMAVRYNMEINGYEAYTAITVCENVGMASLTAVKEQSASLPGVYISEVPVRDYVQSDLAPHIIGNVGRIDAEEYAELKEKGYKLNDVVGKSGIEKIAEDYLRGTDGKSAQGIGSLEGVQQTITDPEPGNTVVLTLASNIQRVAQEELEKVILKIAEAGKKPGNQGADANAGAVVAIGVKTGEVLASANYPTYDIKQMLADYSSVLNADNQPLYNRALQGIYPPGSTFKPLVALAALEEGVITPYTSCYCSQVYTYYSDYQPKCLGYHGNILLTRALAVSCNYYFFDVGRQLKIDFIDEYATLFGLGQKTGIGLGENTLPESAGILAGPEYRASKGQVWNPGDTLQAAIGQSDHLFTPLQLASYVATLCNNGVRYQPRIVKQVVSKDFSEIIVPDEPVLLGTVDASEESFKAVMEGMRSVTTDGTGAHVFADYPIAVGGKTGSAEVPGGSPNAVFIAFAPYEDPQIAVAVVIEHGWHGGSAADVVRAIFDEY